MLNMEKIRESILKNKNRKTKEKLECIIEN